MVACSIGFTNAQTNCEQDAEGRQLSPFASEACYLERKSAKKPKKKTKKKVLKKKAKKPKTPKKADLKGTNHKKPKKKSVGQKPPDKKKLSVNQLKPAMPVKPNPDKFPNGDSNDLASVVKGGHVFILSEVRCQPEAHFVRGWWGVVDEIAPGHAIVRRREHIALLANYTLKNADGSADSNSVWYGDFWCIPKRAWCYQTIDDADYGSKNQKGDVAKEELANIFPLRHSLTDVFRQTIDNSCNIESKK